MNTFNVVMDTNIHSVEFNRRHAICRCVLDCPSLRAEFNTYSENMSIKHGDFIDTVVEFAMSKNLKIISENPSVRVVDDRYVISIEYEFAW